MNGKKKKLPVGIDNFEKLRTQDFYYVDKTGLIIELMNDWGEVNLFTRPRRFGKTLNMSMLRSFFEIGGDKSIFDGLAVSQDRSLCEKYMGKYPVVFLTLKGVDGLTFEVAYERLKDLIREECLRLSFLEESTKIDENEKRKLRRILEENEMVRRLIDKAKNATTRMEVEELIDGNPITKQLNEQLTHSEIEKNINNIWSLLYMTGYLTTTRRPSGGRYTLRIPNHEVRQIFKSQVLEWFSDRALAEADALTDLYAAFEKGDAETIATYLNKQLITTVSYYDARESFYHGFLLALLSTCASWQVSSNLEAGEGRSDIIVEREDGQLGFVVEIKEVKERDKLEAACSAAMRQIEEKGYTAVLQRYGVEEIWTYGIAFCGKRCRVAAKREK